ILQPITTSAPAVVDQPGLITGLGQFGRPRSCLAMLMATETARAISFRLRPELIGGGLCTESKLEALLDLLARHTSAADRAYHPQTPAQSFAVPSLRRFVEFNLPLAQWAFSSPFSPIWFAILPAAC
ncbi:MAG: hypothetical protein ACOCZE_03930, partial [Planctomycetota bacterium]